VAKLSADHQQKLDAAKAQIEALKANVIGLQKIVDDLKAAQAKTADTAKKADAQKDATMKDGTTKEGGKDGAK
jgi:predicted  nucleic acid-binding Zn-ribbon protein